MIVVPPPVPPSSLRAASVTLELLASRTPGTTICPSEVARRIADPAEHWRDAMPLVHAAVDALLAAGSVQLSWKGQPLPVREGPYRIAGRGAIGSGEE